VSLRRLSAALALCAVALAGVVPAAAAARPDKEKKEKEAFSVGAAVVDTTPTEPLCLGGYGIFCGRKTSGVLDPISMRAMVVSSGDQTIAIVTTSAVGWFTAYKDALGGNGIYDVRQQVAAQLPIPADHVLVQADHSHSAPDTVGIWGGVPASYLQRLREAAVQAVTEAYAARVPARLSVGSTVRPVESLYELEPNRATDDEFRLLAADDRDGNRIATLVNYSPHATVLNGSNTKVTGDWISWAQQEAEAVSGGVGLATVGTLGRTSFGIRGTTEEKVAQGHAVLRDLVVRAEAGRTPVRGTGVDADTVFFREVVTQPVFYGAYAPFLGLPDPDTQARIDRSTSAPWLTGNAIGSWAGAARIGDVLIAAAPGEMFPQAQFQLRDQGGVEAQSHFFLGATNDFLGYMAPTQSYPQIAREGVTYLGGCPEDALHRRLGTPHDDACTDHFILAASPLVGDHAHCAIVDAAERIGLRAGAGARPDGCEALTVGDDVAAPAESPGTRG
jgi:hypothetical protein